MDDKNYYYCMIITSTNSKADEVSGTLVRTWAFSVVFLYFNNKNILLKAYALSRKEEALNYLKNFYSKFKCNKIEEIL